MSNFRRYYQNDNIIFLTMVTYDRKPLLIDNIDYVRKSFKNIKYDYKIIAGIILKDHIHFLMGAKNAYEIPKIVASFKTNFSKNFNINQNQTKEQLNRREKGIWQRKYYDHIIRNEQDFNKHLDYIHYNSLKHYNIAPKNWKYSSFKKFVKNGYYDINWCNFMDENKILELNFE